MEAGVSSYMPRVKRSIQAWDHDMKQAAKQSLKTNEIHKREGRGKCYCKWNQFLSVYSPEQFIAPK